MSYQPCRIVVHLILLSCISGGAFAHGDNRHFTPELGSILLKLTMVVLSLQDGSLWSVLQVFKRDDWLWWDDMLPKLHSLCLQTSTRQHSPLLYTIQYISVFVFKDIDVLSRLQTHTVLPIITIFPYSQVIALHVF